MVSITILTILLVMLLFGCLSQGSGDTNDQWSRVSWMGMGCGLILAEHAPNPFAALLIAGSSLGLIWRPPMHETYQKKLAEGLVLAGAYVAAAPHMAAWMVPWLLGMMGAVGAVTGMWAIYSSCQPKDQGYQHEFLGGWLRMVDRDGGAPLAGQGNFNHTQSLGALASSASVGLLFLGVIWAWPLLLLSVAAVVLSTEGRMTGKWMSQGWIHLAVLAIVVAGLIVGGMMAWIMYATMGIGLFRYAHPWNPRKNWYDSGRFAVWNMALRDLWWRANQPREPRKALEQVRADRARMEAVQATAAVEGNALVHNQMTVAKAQNDEHQRRCVVLAKQQAKIPLVEHAERQLARRLWAQRMRVRLLGQGTGSWYPLTKWPAIVATGTMNEATKQFQGMVYLSAHNEYVEVLFEQGLVGLAVVGGLVWYALATTWGTAVFLPVMVLLSVCFTNFPFTLFAEVEKGTPTQPEQFVGSPALLVMSFMILLMVEAVR